LIRFLSILVLAASLRGCVTYEFEHEFWLNTDGSGSFVVTAPPWVWNAVKNVGEARDLDGTVNEQAVAALFDAPAFMNTRVKKVTRQGRPYLTVAADFSDINALVGTRAFPDLVVALRREGARLRLFGVWRRPPSAGTAQGDDHGLMAVRFHLPSEVFDHRNATGGVERGNILSWRQDLRGGIAGAPIDFGATLGTRSVLSATLGLFGLALVAGLGAIATVLIFFTRRGHKRRRKPGKPDSPQGTGDGSDFLNYDPTQSS
jgi:hypothetical protein